MTHNLYPNKASCILDALERSNLFFVKLGSIALFKLASDLNNFFFTKQS
jgi:hypothetical protein